jgi:hypothetical protein
MIVGSCFDGDVDIALAGVQHDLYFGIQTVPGIWIDRGSTLWWIWAIALSSCVNRGHPWLDRNFERMQRIHREGFNHKLLQVPHEHIAAYFRWTMPRVARGGVVAPDRDGPYPLELLDAWRAFLREDIPDLFSSDEALVALAKSMVYQPFDEGERAYHDFQDILMRRYGFECVAKTYWAAAVATRALPAERNPLHSPSAEGGVHV